MSFLKKIIGFAVHNYKPFVFGGIAVFLFFHLKSHFFIKSENTRLQENEKQLLLDKETFMRTYQAPLNEFANYLNNIAPEMQGQLDSMNIKLKNIQKITIQKIKYIDTTTRKTDLDTIITVIENGINFLPGKALTVPIVDVSPCLIVRGSVDYDGESLELNITDRQFKSINEVVSHLERRKWKILGIIPTRLFGKRELKVTVLNSCGESETTVLIKSKGKWQKKR